jgi:hypothetical protein
MTTNSGDTLDALLVEMRQVDKDLEEVRGVLRAARILMQPDELRRDRLWDRKELLWQQLKLLLRRQVEEELTP